MSIDQSFKAFKRDNLKVIYSVKLEKNDSFEKKRIITKIVKFGENNQYGFAMTKQMPTGYIKEYSFPSWLTFDLLFEIVSLDDLIDHLLVVDMEFDQKSARNKQFLYNEILPPIIEKQKVLDANKRSVY